MAGLTASSQGTYQELARAMPAATTEANTALTEVVENIDPRVDR
jgi:hypothetical protein